MASVRPARDDEQPRPSTAPATPPRPSLARLLVAVDEGKHNAAPGTVGWLGERWWEANSGNWTPNTVSTQRSVLYGHIVPHIGSTQLRQLKTADIDMLYGRLRRAGLSPGTIGRVHVVLHSMLNQAVRWGDLGVNPALSAQPPAVGRPDPRPPAKEELQAIAATVLERDPDFHCFLRLAAATGARRGELCALTWADLDLERCSIVINKALPSSGPLKPGPTKTKRGRRFKLDAGTVAVLIEHKARMAERAEASGAKPGSYVFSTMPAESGRGSRARSRIGSSATPTR